MQFKVEYCYYPYPTARWYISAKQGKFGWLEWCNTKPTKRHLRKFKQEAYYELSIRK